MRGRFLPFLLAMALLLPGCSQVGHRQEAEYLLYFAADTQNGHGAALNTQPYLGEEEPSPDSLMAALLAGPTQEGLVSPFPRGVTLQRWAWDQEIEGNLCLWLSEQYSGLADISLTLADYCIVLTLSQLEGVESVEIISDGHITNYRSHQILLPQEAVLPDQTQNTAS